MKKILYTVLIITLIFCFCGCDGSGVQTDNSAHEETLKDDPEQILSDDELLSRLAGEYVNELVTSEHRQMVGIRKDSDGYYYAVIGDGHQGEGLGECKSIDYVDGKYELYFERDEDTTLKIVYTPGKSDICCETASRVERWSTNGEMCNFRRADSEEF